MDITTRDLLQAAVLLGAVLAAWISLKINLARMLREVESTTQKLEAAASAIQVILERLVRHETLDEAAHLRITKAEDEIVRLRDRCHEFANSLAIAATTVTALDRRISKFINGGKDGDN